MQNSIAIGMGQRILSLEHSLKAASNARGEPVAAEDFSYTQAMQMFDRGLGCRNRIGQLRYFAL